MDYSAGLVPQDVDPAVAKYLADELAKIGASFADALARNVEFLDVAPAKPREGMICGADGTNWNPGAGQGVYAYYNSAWNKLG